MRVSFHGHSVIQIEVKGKKLLFDPFITGNPQTDLAADTVEADYILLTHGHNDHVGDTIAIAKRTGATVIACHELATYLGKQGLSTHAMHIGGGYNFEFGRVTLTQAFHGSGFETEDGQILYMGMPAGIIVESEGKTVYHAGDTGLFTDMKWLGERHSIDVAFLPIGDNFTMGPEDAVTAAKWLDAKKVVPMHYNTFPPIKQDPQQYVSSLPKGVGIVLEAGQALEV